MAKLFKISVYITDANDEFSTKEHLEDRIIYCTQNDLNHIKVQCADLGEWDDELPINYIDCHKAEFEKYFKEN